MAFRRRIMYLLAKTSLVLTFITNFKIKIIDLFGYFEAETCMNATLLALDDVSLFENATLIVTPNGYIENEIIPVKGVFQNTYNLLPYSNNLSLWSFVNTSNIINSGTDPFSGNTANLATENTSNAQHIIRCQNSQTYLGLSYTFSVYFKKGPGSTSPDIIQLVFSPTAFAVILPYANFNINTGTITASSNSSPTITSVGSDWYRCSITAICQASANTFITSICFVNNNPTAVIGPTYTGLTTSNILIYGAQLVEGTLPLTYQQIDFFPTITKGNGLITRTSLGVRIDSNNLVDYTPSQNLISKSTYVDASVSTSIWVIQSIGGSFNPGFLAPDGSNSASRLLFGTINRNDYYLHYTNSGSSTSTPSFVASKIRTFYVYAKANDNHQFIGIQLEVSPVTGNYTSSNCIKIDVLNGTLIYTPSGTTVTIESAPNGFFRICVNKTIAWNKFFIWSSQSSSVPTNTITNGNIFWGFQVIDGTFGLSTKFYNSYNRITNVPKIDYTDGCPSILLEGTAINLIQQSEYFVTDWTKTNLTVTSNSEISPDTNLSAALFTATSNNGFVLKTLTQASSQSSNKIFSVWLKRKTGTGNIILESGSNSLIIPITNDWKRYNLYVTNVTGTYNATSGSYIITTTLAHNLTTGDGIRFAPSSGSATASHILTVTVTSPTTFTFTAGSVTSTGTCTCYFITIRIKISNSGDEIYCWGAQMEYIITGSFINLPTSYIPTGGAQVTRTQDNLIFGNLQTKSIISSNFSVYAEISRFGGSNSSSVFILGLTNIISSPTDFIGLYGTGAGNLAYSIKQNNGTIVTAATTYNFPENNYMKIIFVCNGTNWKLFINGFLVNTLSFVNTSLLNIFQCNLASATTNSSVKYKCLSFYNSLISDSNALTLTFIPWYTGASREITEICIRVFTNNIAVPATSLLQKLDIFIQTLKSAGIWTKLDAVYNYAYNDLQYINFSKFNLKDLRFNLTVVGTPTYSINGYVGSGGSNYLRGYNPLGAGIGTVNFSLTNHSYICVIFQEGSVNKQINMATIAGNQWSLWNNNSNQHKSIGNATINSPVDMTGIGLMSMNRLDSTNLLLTNKSNTYNRTQAQFASIGTGYQYAPYGDIGLSLEIYGAVLTNTEIQTIRTAYNVYLVSIGLTAYS